MQNEDFNVKDKSVELIISKLFASKSSEEVKKSEKQLKFSILDLLGHQYGTMNLLYIFSIVYVMKIGIT